MLCNYHDSWGSKHCTNRYIDGNPDYGSLCRFIDTVIHIVHRGPYSEVTMDQKGMTKMGLKIDQVLAGGIHVQLFERG